MENFDIQKLVIYRPEVENDAAMAGCTMQYNLLGRQSADAIKELQIAGIREFEVAKALLQGHKEELSQKIPSESGGVHLFDLCLTFGMDNTAFALAESGVPGCVLEAHHFDLGSYLPTNLPWPRPGQPSNRPAVKAPPPPWIGGRNCECREKTICKYCTWGFPVDQGIWMEDFNLCFPDASSAAKKAMSKPLVLKVLAMILSDNNLPFQVSQKSAARLLDIVILSGNKEAAAALARKNPVRPLRRWNLCEMFGTPRPSWGVQLTHYSHQYPVLLAALHAGATFENIFLTWFEVEGRKMYRYVEEYLQGTPVPFRESVFALGWPRKALAGLLPNSKSPWKPRLINNLGCCLCMSPWVVSLDRLHEATVYGIDVKDWLVRKPGEPMDDGFFSLSLSLLDLSIVKGLADCAAACAAMGMRLRDVKLCYDATAGEVQEDRLLEFGLRTSDADGFLATKESCLCAATAAGRAALKASWRRESAKSIAIYQLLLKLASGRSTEPVVNQVLLFSMEVPEIIDQLGLWDDVAGWQDDLGKPPSAAAGAPANESDAESAATPKPPEIAGALPPFVRHQRLPTLCKIVKLTTQGLMHDPFSHLNSRFACRLGFGSGWNKSMLLNSDPTLWLL